jgi:hypothetical protein
MKHLIEKFPEISKVLQNKKIEVKAGYYNLHTGIVEILKD